MKPIFKRLAVLLASVSLLLPCVRGNDAQAAVIRASTYLSPYNQGWEHDEKSLMNGWHYQAASRQMIYTYYEGSGAPVQAVYCIAPTNGRKTGDVLSEFGDAYISNTSWNSTVSGETVRLLLSHVLAFGYCGQIAEIDSRQGNLVMTEEVLKTFDEALATQILVWEVIVGERNADFSKHSPGGSDPVLSIVKSGMPGYAEYFLPKYNAVADQVSRMLRVPSFLNENQGGAARVKLEWDGSRYSTVLTDENNALDGWHFSGTGLDFSVSGNRLSISAASLSNADDILITASRSMSGRSMTILTDTADYSLSAVQPTAGPGTLVTSERTAYLKAYGDPKGALSVRKSSAAPALTEGNPAYSFAGIRYGVFTDRAAAHPALDTEGREAVLTLKADGSADPISLRPGSYFVKELSVPEGCAYALSSEMKEAAVQANQSLTLAFSDSPLSDPIGLLLTKKTKNGVDGRRVGQ